MNGIIFSSWFKWSDYYLQHLSPIAYCLAAVKSRNPGVVCTARWRNWRQSQFSWWRFWLVWQQPLLMDTNTYLPQPCHDAADDSGNEATSNTLTSEWGKQGLYLVWWALSNLKLPPLGAVCLDPLSNCPCTFLSTHPAFAGNSIMQQYKQICWHIISRLIAMFSTSSKVWISKWGLVWIEAR